MSNDESETDGEDVDVPEVAAGDANVSTSVVATSADVHLGSMGTIRGADEGVKADEKVGANVKNPMRH